MKEILSMDNVSYSYDSEDEVTKKAVHGEGRLRYKKMNGLLLLAIMVPASRHLQN